MGFFSWITADTKCSIYNRHTGVQPFTVYLTAPDGRQWVESDYDGYGEFGGKDIYELIAELNGLTGETPEKLRLAGIQLLKDKGNFDFEAAAKKGVILPTLAESPSFRPCDGLPKTCPAQGFFLETEEDQDAF